MGKGFGVAAAVGLGMVLGAPLSGQERGNGYENLQVLPADISRDELGDTMLGFLRALGLPRRAGAGCLHCHEGSLDVPRSQWNYASDAKAPKRAARRMVAMVRDINDQHLAGLEGRKWPSLNVECATCHAGRTDPRPIEMVLEGAYAASGADSVATVYRQIFQRFYGSDAYDLRVGTLAGMASGLAEEGAYDDALVLSGVNEEAHASDPSARQVTVALRIQRALDEGGPDAALRAFAQARQTEPPQVLTYSVLDGIGWRTYRLEREHEALPLFRANREAFPDLYFTFESLVEARHGAGEITRDEIIAEYESYLAENPDNQMAQQNLTNHRRRN